MNLPNKQYNNILVNALTNLGDVVLSTSAVALLKKIYPNAKITFMVKEQSREVAENNPLIDDVIIFQYKSKENSIGKMLSMIKEIKKRHFDLSISLDRKLRPAILSLLSGIPVRVGPSKVFDNNTSNVTWLYTDTIPINHNLDKTLQAETYQEIIRGFTGTKEHAAPVFSNITSEAEKKADALLESLPKAKNKIALCVKGTFELKTWPKEYFAQTVNTLANEYDAAFFVIGAPNDKQYADEVIEAINLPIANFCGETTLQELAAILKKVNLFITVDTGAAHIAATTEVPMVVMYGCTPMERWRPINKNARVLTSNEPCCPCAYKPQECPSFPKPNCLFNVTPDMILKECRELLSANRN